MKLCQFKLRVYPKTPKDKLVPILDLSGGGGGIEDPPWFYYIFTKGSAIISGKSRKFSLQLYLTYGHESLYTYCYIFSECKEQAWAHVITSLSINGREYGTTFLAIEICSNFKVKYLPLPER